MANNSARHDGQVSRYRLRRAACRAKRGGTVLDSPRSYWTDASQAASIVLSWCEGVDYEFLTNERRADFGVL